MLKNFIVPVFVCLLTACAPNPQTIHGEKITGELIRFRNFYSKYVEARNIDVWLPAGYSKDKKYAVLYMHDGQMLFDAGATWNKQEWRIDETMTRLIGERKIRETIVVGIWNTARRFDEYMPQKAFALADEKQRIDAEKFDIKDPFSDKYLKFVVEELKPYIDRTYSTETSKESTFVMGASMGGLVSLYAISEYPEIFGGAGCLSTHFPAADGVMIEYMKSSLPTPQDHKIYFDYGTATLDASYEPYQLKADEAMIQKGFTRDLNWVTRKFEGEDHSENSWANRVEIPLTFLLRK